MLDTLKPLPCPFCGEDARVREQGRLWYVFCECLVGPTAQGMTEERAWAAWNRRVPSPEVEWRPIAEAPKDGTLVDLWDGEKRITECHYDSAWPKSVGWCGPRDLVNGCRIVNIHPTHFMPLPAPPKED